MTWGEIVLLAYAALMLLGGFVGYAKAGSKPSLIAGLGSFAALIVAWLWARSSVGGLWLGVVVALALCAVFGMRLRKTGKLMPSGVMLVVSIVALGALVLAATM